MSRKPVCPHTLLDDWLWKGAEGRQFRCHIHTGNFYIDCRIELFSTKFPDRVVSETNRDDSDGVTLKDVIDLAILKAMARWAAEDFDDAPDDDDSDDGEGPDEDDDDWEEEEEPPNDPEDDEEEDEEADDLPSQNRNGTLPLRTTDEMFDDEGDAAS